MLRTDIDDQCFCLTCHDLEPQDEGSHEDGLCGEEADGDGEGGPDVVVGDGHQGGVEGAHEDPQ